MYFFNFFSKFQGCVQDQLKLYPDNLHNKDHMTASPQDIRQNHTLSVAEVVNSSGVVDKRCVIFIWFLTNFFYLFEIPALRLLALLLITGIYFPLANACIDYYFFILPTRIVHFSEVKSLCAIQNINLSLSLSSISIHPH